MLSSHSGPGRAHLRSPRGRVNRSLLVGLAVCAAIVLAWGALSIDRCGNWPEHDPVLTRISRGKGPLLAGAARVDFQLNFPTTVGGYGPAFRHRVTRSLAPLSARALVLEVGGERLSLVLLDVLLIPPQLRDAIGQGQPFPTWVLATHTHSGPSGFDPRLASELAALGPFKADDFQVLVTAARSAVAQAVTGLTVCRLETNQALVEGVSVPRSGEGADQRLTQIRFVADQGPVAQLIVAAGHPTLTGRNPEGLHPDWPGVLAQRFELDHGPITLVVQGAGGNSSVDRRTLATPEAAAERVEALVRAAPMQLQADPVEAAWTEVHVWLPRPDGSRLVPAPFTAAVENVLCDDIEDFAVIHGLRLGDVRLLLVPFEPSFAAGALLEEQAGATRLVSLADGYAGYVETVAAVREGGGEARLQYFRAELITRLAHGAKVAGMAF